MRLLASQDLQSRCAAGTNVVGIPLSDRFSTGCNIEIFVLQIPIFDQYNFQMRFFNGCVVIAAAASILPVYGLNILITVCSSHLPAR